MKAEMEFRAIVVAVLSIFRSLLPHSQWANRQLARVGGTAGISIGKGLGISEVFCGAVGQIVPACLIHTPTEFQPNLESIREKSEVFFPL